MTHPHPSPVELSTIDAHLIDQLVHDLLLAHPHTVVTRATRHALGNLRLAVKGTGVTL